MSVCGAKSNCAPPVDSPYGASQQIIAAIAPVGGFPCAQQAISSYRAAPCIGQAASSALLKLLLIASTPHTLPPATAWSAKSRTKISAVICFSITPQKNTGARFALSTAIPHHRIRCSLRSLLAGKSRCHLKGGCHDYNNARRLEAGVLVSLLFWNASQSRDPRPIAD